MTYSENMLDELRQTVCAGMSERRFVHTAEVEKMAVRLGELYAPDKIDILRAAALLHDVTKEKNLSEQIAILEAHGVEVTRFHLKRFTLKRRSWLLRTSFRSLRIPRCFRV